MQIVAEDLVRSFGSTKALSGVSITLEPGKVHALVGENGAGKSTLLKILAGAERPDAGMMTLDGKPYAPRSITEATRRGVGLVFQEITINPALSVAENIFAGQLARFRRGGLLNRAPSIEPRKAFLTHSLRMSRSRGPLPGSTLANGSASRSRARFPPRPAPSCSTN